MALKRATQKNLPIGIDLGTSTVKMAQLRRLVGDDIELVAFGSTQIDPDARQDFCKLMDPAGDAIRKMLRTHPFQSRRCVVSLPAWATFVGHVKIPKLPAGETPKAVQAELRGKLPYPVEQAVVRHIIAGDAFGDGEPRQEVIVVAAPRTFVDACLSMIHHLKLEIVGVSIEQCAIVECFARLFRRSSDAARTILYVDIGAASTQVVLSRGCRVVFAKNLTGGGESFDRVVADGLSISPSQANQMRRSLADGQQHDPAAEEELYRLLDEPIDRLGQELTQCLRYYDTVFRNQAVERVIFLGGQAYDKRLCQAVAQRLDLPAQIGDPLVRVRRVPGAAPEPQRPKPDWAVAVGLSLGADQAA